MTRMMHRPTVTKSKARDTRRVLTQNTQVSNSEDIADETADMSADDDSEDNGGFKTTGWIDQNIGTDFHFQYMYIAGMEVTYSGRKGHLTVHSRGEHRFNMPGRAMTREELTQFAVSCAFQVLSEQYEIFKSEAEKLGCDLVGDR